MTAERKPIGGRGLRRAARWPLLIAVSGAFLLLVGVSTVRESYQEWKVDQEIGGLQTQIEQLEGRKVKLADLLQKLEAPEAVDREARTRLGLRKPGERVIVLRGADADPSWQESLTPAPEAPPPSARSNPQKWFAYFFLHI